MKYACGSNKKRCDHPFLLQTHAEASCIAPKLRLFHIVPILVDDVVVGLVKRDLVVAHQLLV